MRPEYEKRLNNQDLEKLAGLMDQVEIWFGQLSTAVGMMGEAARETVRTRKSMVTGAPALDFAEFLQYLETRNQRAAEALKRAEVKRFELGRLHLMFRNTRERATCKLHTWDIKQALEEAFKIPFNLHLKNSLLEIDEF